jgi:hypothetical protein
MIFELALSWDGKTPALLAALRGDTALYQEAFQVFRKTNYFSLMHPNRSSGPMSDKAMQTILRLDFKYITVIFT